MKLFADSRRASDFTGKYILLDTNFLSEILEDPDFFQDVLDFFKDGFLAIDPLVRFEFLRDTFLPERLEPKEKLINDAEIFFPVIDHYELFSKLQNNALLLSKIYVHQNQANCKPGFIDLMLASRLMLHPSRAVLVTANKKDFGSCVFDITTVMNIERRGSILSFVALIFNKTKFDTCMEELGEARGMQGRIV
ncbi:MAG: hypothetical protein Q8P78_03045 [bacterium]|nr:hypothetical protein [bacterium]